MYEVLWQVGFWTQENRSDRRLEYEGEMTPEQIKTMSAAKVAKQLQEYQKYRRGEPPYIYGIVPHRQPFTSFELGAIIDRAIELLTEQK
jgi:hypothetical protein